MRWIIAGLMALGVVLAVASGWIGRWGMFATGLGIALLFGLILIGIYGIEDKRRQELQAQQSLREIYDEARADFTSRQHSED